MITKHPYNYTISPSTCQHPLDNNARNAKDMPAFLKRLNSRFSGRSERTHSCSTPSLQQYVGSAKAGDDGRYSTDTIYTKPSSSRTSLVALPVITDNGPPGRNRYVDDDIFWNSVMLEADHDPPKRSSLPMSPGQKPGFYNIKTVTNVDAKDPLRGFQDTMREEIHREHCPKPPIRRHSAWPTAGLGESAIPRDEIRRSKTNNDLIVIMARPLDSEPPAQVPPFPSGPPAPTAVDVSSVEHLDHAYDPPSRRAQSPPHTSAEQCVDDEEARNNETLTWNSVLGEILANGALNPFMRERVHERVKASSFTNGIGHGKRPVTARAAGLVPNFSRPVYGSGFYSRTSVEPPMKIDEAHGPSPVGEDSSEAAPESNLPNGTHSSDNLYRSPTPASDFPANFSDLLTEHLTPAEFCLYSRLIGLPSPSHDPTSPSSSSATPLHAQLVHSLHTLLLGLQERNNTLKEDPKPQHSSNLEAKSTATHALQEDVAFREEQIIELKRCFDYAIKVLQGCWAREWELWRTLADIRRRHLAAVGLLGRLVSRGVGRRIGELADEEGALYRGMPEGYPRGYDARQLGCEDWDEDDEGRGSGRRGVGEKELDALMLMAKQNVEIVKLDVGEVVYMMREFRCMVRKAGKKMEEEREREKGEPGEGSLRDA